jgi:hypothetical protein
MISINQRGAGNGKTYDSIAKIATEEDYNTFIYLAKTHSAIFVIKTELETQHVSYESVEESSYKQYVYRVNNKLVIIGTVDSFNYALHQSSHRVDDEDFCRQFRKTILNGHSRINEENVAQYSKQTINFDDTLIVLDEAQDLHPEYLEVLTYLNLNVYIIGDLLQSLYGENNIMNAVQGVIPINYKDNIVRRFNNNILMSFVNKVAEFKKYNLPQIVGISDSADTIGNVKLIEVEFDNSTKSKKLSNYDECKMLWIKIENEMNYLIQAHNYTPENFMFIFPILNKQQFPIVLQSNVDVFWKNKYGIDKQYCFLHKSEDSKPIDFKESVGMSKILSIHASKGSGCEVVFVFDLTMVKLDPFKEPRSNLKIDSMVHVAITRSKNYLILGYSSAFSDCCVKRKIVNALGGTPSQESEFIKNSPNSLINIIHDMYLDIKHLVPIALPSKESIKSLNVVDWNHHVIRSNVMEFIALFYMASLKQHNYSSDLMVKFTSVLRMHIRVVKCAEYINNFNYMNLNSKVYLKEIQKFRQVKSVEDDRHHEQEYDDDDNNDNIDLYEDDIDVERVEESSTSPAVKKGICNCQQLFYGKRDLLINVEKFEQTLKTSNCWFTPCKISHNVLFIPQNDSNREDVSILANIMNTAIDKFKSIGTFRIDPTSKTDKGEIPNLSKMFCVFEMTVLTFLMKFSRNCESVLYDININDLLSIVKKRKNTVCTSTCKCCVKPVYNKDAETFIHYNILNTFDSVFSQFVQTLNPKSNFKQHLNISAQIPYFVFVDRYKSSIIPFIEYDNIREKSVNKKILKSLIYFAPSLTGFNISRLICDIIRDIAVIKYAKTYEDKKLVVKSDNGLMKKCLYLYIKNMDNNDAKVKDAHTKVGIQLAKSLKKLHGSYIPEFMLSDSIHIHIVTLTHFQSFDISNNELSHIIENIKKELAMNLFDIERV